MYRGEDERRRVPGLADPISQSDKLKLYLVIITILCVIISAWNGMRVPYSGINQTDQTLSSRLGLGTFLIKLTCLRQPWKPVGKILNPTCTPTTWASILIVGYWLMHLRSWENEILSERKNSSVQISNFRASSREEPRHGEERNSEVSRGSEKCQSLSSHCPPAGAQRRPTCQWMILMT